MPHISKTDRKLVDARNDIVELRCPIKSPRWLSMGMCFEILDHVHSLASAHHRVCVGEREVDGGD